MSQTSRNKAFPIIWISTIFFCCPLLTLTAQEESKSIRTTSIELPLWADEAPLAAGKQENDIPRILVSFPQQPPLADSSAPTTATLPALIIYPGGGYGHLAMGHEGVEMAQWANSLGMVAAICDYRHRGKGYGHPAPLLDAQRAIRLVRSNAEHWNVDPSKVGIIGFSAGGHLASTVLTHLNSIQADGTFLTDEQQLDARDPIDRFSNRPDFGLLCYPVIGMGVDFTHGGSQKNLFGPDPSPDLLALYNNYQQVTSDTPPTFVFHTLEDTVVPVRNSLEFFAAMNQHGVDGELHVFQQGRHGIGLGRDVPGANRWPELARIWLTNRKIIDEASEEQKQ